MSSLVDKVKVKAIVGDILGQEWVIPNLYVGNSLPLHEWAAEQAPFVIKTNHGSGQNIFVHAGEDLTEETWSRHAETMRGWLNVPYEPARCGNIYKGVAPKALIEPMISLGELPIDYKVFTFGGKAHFIHVLASREKAIQSGFFSTNWEELPFSRVGHHPLDGESRRRPSSLGAMLAAAEELARGTPFVRVDFYDVGGKPLFGEMTFTPAGGLATFQPRSYDAVLGDLWQGGYLLEENPQPDSATL